MKWINLQDQEPENKERVLIYDKFSDEINIARWFSEENQFWEDEIGNSWSYTATHWQKLPERPIMKGKNNE